jgi:3-phosphoshikimate 1-carboxyvinyltransferase
MTSKPYVLMTLWMQKQFGIKVNSHVDRFVVPRQNYKPASVRVEGDWSSASYFLTLGAGAKAITVENLATGSLQGDRIILDYLRSMGARAQVRGKSITVSGGRELRAIHADMTDCIDLLPTMGILAALANGITDLTGIERARIKESNRVAAVRQGLERLGIPVTETADRLKITGLNTPIKVEAAYGEDEDENKKEEVKETPPPVVIDSFDDHRIAMAFGILGSIIGCTTVNEHDFGDIVIDGAECVAKTFPDFWELLKAVGGAVEKDE